MTVRKLILPALAAIASATVSVGLATTADAAPIGPCAEVPYVGVCVPPSEAPTPTQQSHAENAFIPDTSSGINVVN
jgi:hypothetical protein